MAQKNNGNGKKKRRPGPVGWWLSPASITLAQQGAWVSPKGKYIDIGFWRQFHERRYVQLDPVTGDIRVDGKKIEM